MVGGRAMEFVGRIERLYVIDFLAVSSRFVSPASGAGEKHFAFVRGSLSRS